MSEVKVIESIKRGPTSYYGNPSYWITFTDGTRHRTMANTSCAYAVGNPDMREGCVVSVEFTKSGTIRHMGPVRIITGAK